MLVSTRGRYALRVMIDLAEHQADGFIPLKVIAERQVEEGVEIIETRFPVLCTATKESNKPRYATVKGVMRSFRTEIGQITLADLPDADTTKMGLKGSPTKVKATFTPKRTANCVNIEGVSPVEIADNLIGKLVEAKVL